MANRDNPFGMIFMALGMMLVGAYVGINALGRPSEEDEAAKARPLRPRSAPPEQERPGRGAQAAAGLVFVLCGAGVGLYGLRKLSRQAELLTAGVPVEGRVIRVRESSESTLEFTYRFEDRHGGERQGIHYCMEGPDALVVGQEVTVVYDPADPSRHMLDLDNVRRARAARRL